MVDVLKIFIEQLNSSVIILLVLLVLAFFLLYKIGGWINNFEHDKKRLDKFEEKTEKFIEIATKVDLIYQHVNPNLAVKNTSPLSLTEAGKKMQKEMNADIVFNRIVASEKEKILKSHKEKNAYDIQMACVEWSKKYTLPLLTEVELDVIKKVAFNNGILLEDVLAILGIMMRNHILKELEISIADVDIHAPA